MSRQFLWTFLHSHPFYNSEQVSQRYVEVKKGNYAIPRMGAPERELYEKTARRAQEAYTRLTELLTPLAAERYFGLFPGRTRGDGPVRFAGAVQKRAQEIARYVLPVATFSYLYHTVSGVTLFRYWRLCESMDAPAEQREVVGQMVAEVLRHDPLYAAVLQDPLPLEETPEYAAFRALPRVRPAGKAFREEFDRELSGRVSRLVDWKANNEEVLAYAVREVLGVPRAALSDDEAIRTVLDPSRNRILGETLTLTTHDKLSRALFHPSYTFRKKLSHTADSQDQRHRMTPASRPALPAYLSEEPDYVVPMLVADVPEADALYRETMEADLGRDRPAARAGRGRRIGGVPPAQRRGDPLHGVRRPAEPPPQVRDAPLLQRAGGDLARVAGRGAPDQGSESAHRPLAPAALHAAPPGRRAPRVSGGRTLLRGRGLEAGPERVHPRAVAPAAARARPRGRSRLPARPRPRRAGAAREPPPTARPRRRRRSCP